MAVHSSNSRDYLNIINNLVRPDYKSKYGTQTEAALNRIINSQGFTYDFQQDPMWQKVKQENMKLNAEAIENGVQANEQLTGGYGNSYVDAAASQSNQQHLDEMNNMIPQLMQAAEKKYQNELENNYRQFGALQSEESRQYAQYQDEVGDYKQDVSNANAEYARALAQENYKTEQERQAARDAISDARYADKFAYQKERDSVSDTRAADKLAYQKARDAVSDSQWAQELAYKRERGDVSDRQFAQNLAYKKARAAIEDQRFNDNLAYKYERAGVDDYKWGKEFDLKVQQYNEALQKAKSSGGSRYRVSNDNDNEEVQVNNSETMTVKDAELMLATLVTLDEDEADKMIRKAKNEGKITKADANYLWQEYHKRRVKVNEKQTSDDKTKQQVESYLNYKNLVYGG